MAISQTAWEFLTLQILQDVQLSGLFPDSKTFVDKPTNGTLNATLQAFSQLGNNITLGQLAQFVKSSFVRIARSVQGVSLWLIIPERRRSGAQPGPHQRVRRFSSGSTESLQPALQGMGQHRQLLLVAPHPVGPILCPLGSLRKANEAVRPTSLRSVRHSASPPSSP